MPRISYIKFPMQKRISPCHPTDKGLSFVVKFSLLVKIVPMEWTKVLQHIMEDLDYDISDGSISDEE